MKYILILLSVMLIACTTTPTKEVSTPKVVKPLVSKKGTPIAFIFISCISLEATKNILEGDKFLKQKLLKDGKHRLLEVYVDYITLLFQQAQTKQKYRISIMTKKSHSFGKLKIEIYGHQLMKTMLNIQNQNNLQDWKFNGIRLTGKIKESYYGLPMSVLLRLQPVPLLMI